MKKWLCNYARGSRKEVALLLVRNLEFSRFSLLFHGIIRDKSKNAVQVQKSFLKSICRGFWKLSLRISFYAQKALNRKSNVSSRDWTAVVDFLSCEFLLSLRDAHQLRKQDAFCTRKRQKHGNVFPLFSGGFLCSCVPFAGRLYPWFPPLVVISSSGTSVPLQSPHLCSPRLEVGEHFSLTWYSFLFPKMFWLAPQNHFSFFWWGGNYTFGLLVKERECNDCSARQLSSALYLSEEVKSP